MTEKDRILATVKSVPSLPSVVMKLRKYLNDPEVSFDELAKVIQYDPGLTANVLQLANSAYFGWSGTISSIKGAISRLGTNRIFQMVLCMSVAPLVSKPIKGYDMDAGSLWEHSIAVAVCAEQLAKKLKMEEASDAFTAGLLHDMGKVVLGTFVEVDDQPIREIVESDSLAFNEAERMVLGVDHAEVAAVLLEDWQLPADVVASARWHHEPNHAGEDYQNMVDLVHVADILCLNVGWGAGSDGLQYRLNEKASTRLGIEIEGAEEVVLEVMMGMEDLKDMYKLRPARTPQGV
jgi:putative nucleotidyltransferase with HDIG domain